MADARAKELVDLGDRLYTKRQPLLTLWQEIALNFYVERADFTSSHVYGEEFSDHLMDSHPLLMRRELGNHISAMLRPRDRAWFKMSTLDESRDADPHNAAYMEYAARKLKALIYHPKSKFIRATKETDHDFVTFGQGIISVEESRDRTHPFFRNFHLKDCAWLENADGDVDHLHRKDKMTARKMRMTFGNNKLDRLVKDACKKNPGQEFNIRCIIMPSDEYDYIGKGSKNKNGNRLPFVVIYVDADNGKILKEDGMPDFPYCVPRWHTVSGWQYAYSPATVIALPDARMLQEMGRIILEAGEKSVDPPVVAVEEAIREVNIAAGAITWADIAFDGKLREAIAPIPLDTDMRTAFAMRQDMREMLAKAWFIDKITLPDPATGEMTAYEVGRRLEEFVRNLLPLFEPIEIEYNTKVLDKAFALGRNMGVFPAEEVPQDLAGEDVSWQFESPVQSSSQRLVVTQFQEVLGLIAAGVEAGVQTMPVDLDLGLRDAIRGTQAPAAWMISKEQAEAEAAEKAEQAQMGGMLQEVAATAEVAGQVADASQRIDQAMIPAPTSGPGSEPIPIREAA